MTICIDHTCCIFILVSALILRPKLCVKMKGKLRVILSEFIIIYRNNPLLWKVKSKDYSNKILRNKALDALHKKLKELQPDCSKDDVLRKLTIFAQHLGGSIKNGKCQKNLALLWKRYITQIYGILTISCFSKIKMSQERALVI